VSPDLTGSVNWKGNHDLGPKQDVLSAKEFLKHNREIIIPDMKTDITE
jgi:hypothetical protein